MVRGITFCQSDLKKILKLYLPWNPTEVNREVERIFLAKLRIHIRPHLSQPDIPGFIFFFVKRGYLEQTHQHCLNQDSLLFGIDTRLEFFLVVMFRVTVIQLQCGISEVVRRFAGFVLWSNAVSLS